MTYWANYEKSLLMIEQQLRQPEVELTIRLLEKKSKFIVNAFKYDMNFQ